MRQRAKDSEPEYTVNFKEQHWEKAMEKEGKRDRE